MSVLSSHDLRDFNRFWHRSYDGSSISWCFLGFWGLCDSGLHGHSLEVMTPRPRANSSDGQSISSSDSRYSFYSDIFWYLSLRGCTTRWILAFHTASYILSFMNEGLFFQVQPILWEHSLSYTIIWVLTMIFIWWISLKWIRFIDIFLKKKRSTQLRELIPIFTLIPTDSSTYEEDTLRNIRAILTHIYNPEHSYAHTPKEMDQYIENTELESIIQRLESSIYTGIPLAQDIRTSISENCKKYFSLFFWEGTWSIQSNN